jgi:hypothetical protein
MFPRQGLEFYGSSSINLTQRRSYIKPSFRVGALMKRVEVSGIRINPTYFQQSRSHWVQLYVHSTFTSGTNINARFRTQSERRNVELHASQVDKLMS